MEYLARYNVYFGIFICSATAIMALFILFIRIPDLATRGRCKYTKNGFKTKSDFCSAFYYLCSVSVFVVGVLLFVKTDIIPFYWPVIWMTCIIILLGMTTDGDLYFYKGMAYEVDGEYLYIGNKEKMKIIIPWLKKDAKKIHHNMKMEQ